MQVYPVEEELEIMQRFLAYCLVGMHDHKFLLFLTVCPSAANTG